MLCELQESKFARAVQRNQSNMPDSGRVSHPLTCPQKRPAESVPDAAALCAFSEHPFGLWKSRVPGEVLAKKVAALTMRMTASGANAAKMAESMKAEWKLDFELGAVMDLVVA